MSHFANDVHHRLSTRIRDIIPDFIFTKPNRLQDDNLLQDDELPKFIAFLRAYYEFLEQYDDQPVAPTYTFQPGVVSVRAGNSTIIGNGTHFSNNSVYANNTQFRVGSDQFRIRSIANNTQLVVYEIPPRSYFANSHSVQTGKSSRQASGAIRQVLTHHDVEHTLDDFVVYFRDTYLRDIPEGLTNSAVLIPRILDFYQSKGSEQSYQFLFQSLYGKSVAFSYPRDSVFTTSDNEWVRPNILRLAYNSDVTGNVALLETREIIGLSSNARATVLQAVSAYEGSYRVIRLFISDPIVSRGFGQLLLEDGTGTLVVTKYGTPQEGELNIASPYNLVQEFVSAGNFMAGETISTVPVNDPDAITGNLLGSVNGFFINKRGSGYALGDLVYPPAKLANGAASGVGAVGKITEFTDVDINKIDVIDPGVGYYEGLPLEVDNTGAGAGIGLAGHVDAVAPGNIVLHEDAAAGIADGDNLLFVYGGDTQFYKASRETIDYYELGVLLSPVLHGLLQDDGERNPHDILDEEEGRQLLTEAAVFIDDTQRLGDLLQEGDEDEDGHIQTEDNEELLTEMAIPYAWDSTPGSALYGVNLRTPIIQLTANLTLHYVLIDGVRTAVGEVSSVKIDEYGEGYKDIFPTVTVATPTKPTSSDPTEAVPLSYKKIFGEEFRRAVLRPGREPNQIGRVEVITGGTGYINVAFSVNSSTSTTTTGKDAVLSLSLGAISYGDPYFRNTRSFGSSDQYLQDITKYQPFSYVMSVEEDLSRYAAVLKKLVHPAGGLLLPRQTITTEIDLTTTIGIELLSFVVAASMHISAPSVEISTEKKGQELLVAFETVMTPYIEDTTDEYVSDLLSTVSKPISRSKIFAPIANIVAERSPMIIALTPPRTLRTVAGSATVLRIKPPAAYGYLMGGTTGAGVDTTDKLTFGTGSIAASTASNLTVARYGAAGISDVRQYGYALGGYSTTGFTTLTDRLAFSTGATLASTISNISAARRGQTGISDGNMFGYSMGGYTNAYVTAVDKLDFSTSITAASNAGTLSQARHLMAAISEGVRRRAVAVAGYVMGGFNGSALNRADKITFSSGVVASSTISNLSSSREGPIGISDGDVYGYAMGGTLFKTTDRITFSTGITAVNTVSNLTVNAAASISGTSDGSLYGYAAFMTGTTDRIVFSTGTTSASTAGTLSLARSIMAGVSDGAV